MAKRRALLLLCSALALQPTLSSNALAQAWLPPKGEGFVSLGYSNAFVSDHYIGTAANPGDTVQTNRGHIRAQSVGIDLGYAITDRFLVTAGLPFAYSKWYPFEGIGRAHDPHVDNGEYHGTFQDYRIEALYQVVRDPVALTAFAGIVFPSHGYQYFAHSAAGRDLREYLLGFNFGSRLDRILPGSYVQARYSYAFVEEVFVENVGDIHHDRSNFGVELGYFLTTSLGVRFLASGFYTHGGLVFTQPADFGTPLDATNPLFLHHDQIGHDSALSMGGGLVYSLTGSVDVYASYLRTVMGHGGHKVDHGLAFGFSWGFSPAQMVRRVFRPGTPLGEPPIQP